MKFFDKFFRKNIIVAATGNKSVSTIELDPSKKYILLVKTGSMNQPGINMLRNIDPEKITVVSYND